MSSVDDTTQKIIAGSGDLQEGDVTVAETAEALNFFLSKNIYIDILETSPIKRFQHYLSNCDYHGRMMSVTRAFSLAHARYINLENNPTHVDFELTAAFIELRDWSFKLYDFLALANNLGENSEIGQQFDVGLISKQFQTAYKLEADGQKLFERIPFMMRQNIWYQSHNPQLRIKRDITLQQILQNNIRAERIRLAGLGMKLGLSWSNATSQVARMSSLAESFLNADITINNLILLRTYLAEKRRKSTT